jgi:hypothetical protein
MTSDDVDELRDDPAPQPIVENLAELLELLRIAGEPIEPGAGVWWFQMERAILDEQNTMLNDLEERFYELTQTNGVNNGKGYP